MDKGDLRNTAIVMFSLVLVTLTGFLRQSVIAYSLGADRTTDIYLVAYAVPEFIFIALPVVLSPVLLPLFSQIRHRHGERSAWYWGFRISSWIILVIFLIIICLIITTPVFVKFLSPGFSPIERELAASLFFRMLPGILLMGLSAILGTFLQGYRCFSVSVLTTGVYNLTFIAGILWLPQQEPLNRTGWSVTIGALAAVVFQIPFVLRVWRSISIDKEPLSIEWKYMREAFRLLGWMAAGYSVHHLILFIDRAMATTQGEGVAAILNFGYHPALIVAQVSGLAVSFVVFPTLVESVSAEQLDGVQRSLRLALGLVLAIALPVGVGLVILREPLVRFLFEHGEFSAQATTEVSTILAIYTLALTFDALCQPLWRLVYASRQGWIVFVINSIQTVVRLVANIILINLIGYIGLAWSAVVGLMLQLFILGGLANRWFHFTLGRLGWINVGKIFLATFCAGVVAWSIDTIGRSFLPEIPYVIRMGTAGIILLVVYSILIIPLLKKTQWIRNPASDGG